MEDAEIVDVEDVVHWGNRLNTNLAHVEDLARIRHSISVACSVPLSIGRLHFAKGRHMSQDSDLLRWGFFYESDEKIITPLHRASLRVRTEAAHEMPALFEAMDERYLETTTAVRAAAQRLEAFANQLEAELKE